MVFTSMVVAVIGSVAGEPMASPAPGCWAENYVLRDGLGALFAKGGRLGRDGPFLKEIPSEAFEPGRPLKIEAGDARTYTIHGHLYAGAYISGWIDEASSNANLVGHR